MFSKLSLCVPMVLLINYPPLLSDVFYIFNYASSQTHVTVILSQPKVISMSNLHTQSPGRVSTTQLFLS